MHKLNYARRTNLSGDPFPNKARCKTGLCLVRSSSAPLYWITLFGPCVASSTSLMTSRSFLNPNLRIAGLKTSVAKMLVSRCALD